MWNCTFDHRSFASSTFDVCVPEGHDAGGGGSHWDERFHRKPRKQDPEEDDGLVLALYAAWQMINRRSL